METQEAFTFGVKFGGFTLILLFALHRILALITPKERKLEREPLPLPVVANVKKSPSNNETYSVVVGGSGFLGSYITKQLIERGEKVKVVDLVKGKEPKAEYKLTEAFQDAKVVFHTVSVIEFNNMPKAFDINVVGTRHIINACFRAGVTRLVYTSSVAVLMDGKDIVSGDETNHTYATHHLSPYGTTKTLAELMVIGSNGKYGLRTVAIRPPGIFGPTEMFVGAANPKQPIFNGKTQQGWVYVENAAHYHIAAGDALTTGSPVAGQFYFIGDGYMTGVEFMRALAIPLGAPNQIVVPKSIGCILPTTSAKFSIVYFKNKEQNPFGGHLDIFALIVEAVYLFGGGYFTHQIFQVNLGFIRMMHLTLVFSTKRAEKDLNYKPLYTLEEGIEKTVAELKQLIVSKSVKQMPTSVAAKPNTKSNKKKN